MVKVIVTRRFQVTIPKEIREALGISVGDRLLVRVVDGKIVMEPIRGSEALKRLSTIVDRYLGGVKRVDAVKLVEESLERETGLY
ncbi:MAG: AbrB/MazE/SpoVT family DNA-binding domain-containing protein [Sulfolobales archaeon]